MPGQLSLATVAACAALAVAGFGGAYALAHGGPAKPAPALASPTTIHLKDEPIGELQRVSRLPAMVVPPPPRPQPVVTQPVVTTPVPVVSAPAPAPVVSAPRPTPAPKPKPKAPAKKPQTFDNSG